MILGLYRRERLLRYHFRLWHKAIKAFADRESAFGGKADVARKYRHVAF
jgi:hypothetical protein